MKKQVSLIAILICAVAGIVRVADLILNTDPKTGFIISGSILLRYLLLFVPIVLIAVFAAFKKNIKEQPKVYEDSFFVTYAACLIGGISSGVATLFLFILNKATIFDAVVGIFITIGSIWFFVMARKKSSNFVFGIILNIGYILLAVYIFVNKSSSVYRMEPSIELLAALSAVLILTYLLKLYTVSLQKDTNINKFIFFYGMTAFYICCCVFLPQQIWELFTASAELDMAAKTMALASIGFLGLICALRANEMVENQYNLQQATAQTAENPTKN